MSRTLDASGHADLPQTAVQENAAAADATVPQSDSVAHAFAGAGGGLLSTALTYPLITLSTRAQVESKKSKASTISAVKKILKREGVSGLYAGLESALIGITITNFVYYYWYEFSRDFLARTSRKSGLSTVQSIAAGAIAGTATVVITNPIWVVNTRMTAGKQELDEESDVSATITKKQNPSSLRTLLKILRDDGIMQLFAGVLPALVLVTNPILQYTIFEQLKQVLEKRRVVTAKDSFVLGAMGKLAATTITYPYITVKSRAHVADCKGGNEGMTASLGRIVREEGIAGLYGGIGTKVAQSVFTAALLFALKDILYDATIKARSKFGRRK